jgi:hypothetical protein
MNVWQRGMVLATMLIAGITSFGVGMAATVDRYPPAPPWVRPDGTVDHAKLPACIVVLGQDGQPARDTTGKAVCMPTAEIFAPPVTPPGQAETNSAKVLRRYTDAKGREVIQVESQMWPFNQQ